MYWFHWDKNFSTLELEGMRMCEFNLLRIRTNEAAGKDESGISCLGDKLKLSFKKNKASVAKQRSLL